MFLQHIVIAEGIQEHVGPGFHPGVVCVTRHLIWFGSNGRENCGKIFGDAMATAFRTEIGLPLAAVTLAQQAIKIPSAY
jgi:hypothetical protein